MNGGEIGGGIGAKQDNLIKAAYVEAPITICALLGHRLDGCDLMVWLIDSMMVL